ncbi:MAG: hypothetical protein HOL07_02815 [Rhodospirillaceae bacterium]|jgi:hypothetical protein|nr:hypothetical protein [Rhodospirillaceae bacterium]MBT5357252.1 hypothetical protein [Rhodospirillaceae bacterium]MBT5770292.1 hypothetical protein [Rhodospirillaceae bacterium]MBT6311075.1 hypothetical protein [Rhodospirillaceae bacterium]MBT7366247.1 hypothetical protein [Rhodospirillaceae bacterium]
MRHIAFSIVAALGLAACTTFDGSADNPAERSLTWFSYVAGDDIRAACTADSPDQYRFVYNAVYERQIRAYDLRLGAVGADQNSRARNRAGNVANFQFRNPLGPWELRRSDARLADVEVAAIVDGLQRDVANAPASAGQRLRSNKFYWAVAACQSGEFRLHAFEQDRVAIQSLAFRTPLLAHDMTGVEFLEAEQIEGFADNAFEIKINRTGDGIVGLF